MDCKRRIIDKLTGLQTLY